MKNIANVLIFFDNAKLYTVFVAPHPDFRDVNSVLLHIMFPHRK